MEKYYYVSHRGTRSRLYQKKGNAKRLVRFLQKNYPGEPIALVTVYPTF